MVTSVERHSLSSGPGTVLILTPVRQAASQLDRYFELLSEIDYPIAGLSVGFLEGDSSDGSYERLAAALPSLRTRYRRVTLTKWDSGFALPPGAPRWAPPLQLPRRVVLAKARNRLLSAALADEDWVLWLDVDVADYPADVLRRLLAAGRSIVTPHCVTEYGGPTFDWNAWRDHGRVRMDALRGGRDLVRLDAVGGTMLLVRADLHREGLVFPPYLYGRQSLFARDPSPFANRGVGEVETEGLGLMAKDMGHECWGMPNLEIVHRNE
jgi:Anp1